MKSEPNLETFYRAFSSRAEIATALLDILSPTPNSLVRLKNAIAELGDIISEIGKGDTEDQYLAYHTAASIFLILAQWKQAIRNAEPDSQRFLSSAKLKASEIDKTLSYVINTPLEQFLNHIELIQELGQLSALHGYLNEWDLPLLLFSKVRNNSLENSYFSSSENDLATYDEQKSTIAFLRFEIDGSPAESYNYLKPGVSYDLTIEVRVSNWPQEASALTLTPITIDMRERDWLPSFRFVKPDGDGPFSFTGTGRAILQVAHSFGSRPYEFLYAAEFDNTKSCKNVEIVGHRRLLLEGTDVVSNPRTGFSHVDRHLLKIRNKMRSFPGLHSDDIANTMLILEGLGNVAAQALKASLFEANTSEKLFQSKLAEMLRSRAEIGESLEGHPEAAGGITDLIFKGIPIELKVENTKVLFAKDFTKYFNQTTAYAIGLGKKIGILTILESTAKTEPVGVIEDDIDFFIHQTGQSAIVIIVVVVRGGLAKPSFYSR
ncbi:TPA: hypothetical protein MW256_003754 [Acinetobacter baumannii]|nr:hypothetical protein [Acinetobacter baumannii]